MLYSDGISGSVIWYETLLSITIDGNDITYFSKPD